MILHKNRYPNHERSLIKIVNYDIIKGEFFLNPGGVLSQVKER